jgi:RNA recognition motif-containing protein
MLRDVFNQFGIVLSTKIMRDPETGVSKKYGFVAFDNFDSSDSAINIMNGQYLEGRPIDVSYSYKKDANGEKHGSAAERVLAFCQNQRQQQTEAKISELMNKNQQLKGEQDTQKPSQTDKGPDSTQKSKDEQS